MERRYCIIVCMILCCLKIAAQEPWEGEKFDERTLKDKIGTLTPFPTWINDTHCFYYPVYDKEGNVSYFFVDADKRVQMPLFDADSLKSKYSKLAEMPYSKKVFKPYSITFIGKDVNRFYFKENGRWYFYNRLNNDLKWVEKLPLPQETTIGDKMDYPYYQQISPDGKYLLYGRGHNVVVKRAGASDKEAVMLTHDGVKYHSYNSINRDIAEDRVGKTMARWIPGTATAYAFREDKREVKEMGYLDALSIGRPDIVTYKMEMPGDKEVTQYDMTLFDVSHHQSIHVPIYKFKDQTVSIKRVDNSGIYFTRTARTLDTLELCRVNPKDGEVKMLISEITHPHINNLMHNFRFINGGRNIVWWSERTGKGAYYLYDNQGKLLNRITQGELVAGDIAWIDTLRHRMIFGAYGADPKVDPEYRYYYSVDMNGKNQQMITPGEGCHEISLSKDGKVLIDHYSRVDLPPVSQVIRVSAKPRPYIFYKADITPLLRYGWHPPTRIKVKAADDSTSLYGVMYKPFNMEPGKKYPIISNVYPGPQSNQIPVIFDLDDNHNQDLAELGFIVVNVAPRGSSPLRGKDFYCFSVGNMRDYPLADDKYALEQLAKEYPFIDLSKVGIYGHSGGGFMTVSAMLTYPDFYKVAVAASGNYDNNIYTREWTELYQGVLPYYDKKNHEVRFTCVCPTPLSLAKNLKGKLLLISGDIDKNVSIASTYRLMDALIKADKIFDLMVLPGKDHAVACPYYYKLIRRYFYNNLK